MPTVNEGRGFFFYPPLTVSENGAKELGKVLSEHVREIALDFQLSDKIRIIVTEDGFLCPIINMSLQELPRFLNTIISTLTTKFTASDQISWEQDWASFKFKEGDTFVEIGYSKGGVSVRNMIEFERDDSSTFHLWKEMPRRQITSGALEGFIKQAYRFYTNPEYADDLLLIGESWSLSYNHRENASFLYSWMIIENLIEKSWKKYVDSLNRTTAEKDFLKSHNSWYVSHMIQGLSLAGKIDDDTRETLNKLRKIRNEIVHNRHRVSKNEAYDCMNIVTEMVYDKLNVQDDFLVQHKKLKYIL